MRTTKVEGACFGSERSPLLVWAPRPEGQLVVSSEFTGCTCFSVFRAQPGPDGGGKCYSGPGSSKQVLCHHGGGRPGPIDSLETALFPTRPSGALRATLDAHGDDWGSGTAAASIGSHQEGAPRGDPWRHRPRSTGGRPRSAVGGRWHREPHRCWPGEPRPPGPRAAPGAGRGLPLDRERPRRAARRALRWPST